ncbi:shikimate kinase [Pleurocapsa sp. PCC 7327]|uniref:shikimate kinase n=1 Tax=Pleurocapsa sp. PCC 7327 TaxID=118163 RepID=UPI00029FF243|nr:shikimate kinase [Pleurocapsa sp. PCC 7327]AFY76832.1 shikimate kinase [Pleurocapsa sp. PCC 7327]
MTNLLQGVSVFLVGIMGTGKTTVGQILAQQLGYRFFDTDVLIERVAGQTINEIFARQGEERFRELETQVLAELSAYTKSVIATGGGIVMRPINWSYLHHGLIVWLDAPVELLRKRLAEDTTRPLLQAIDRAKKLSSLLEIRRPLYQQADLQIAIAQNQTPEQITAKLIEQIPTVLKSKATPPEWQ